MQIDVDLKEVLVVGVKVAVSIHAFEERCKAKFIQHFLARGPGLVGLNIIL